MTGLLVKLSTGETLVFRTADLADTGGVQRLGVRPNRVPGEVLTGRARASGERPGGLGRRRCQWTSRCQTQQRRQWWWRLELHFAACGGKLAGVSDLVWIIRRTAGVVQQ